MKVMVEISARHVHVTDEHLETLFGAGHKLTRVKDLSQPNQYSCEERVTVVGPKGEIGKVVILGPTRPETQVELSLTDARKVGIDAPIRESGDLAGTPGCKLVGPAGEIELENGVIAAKRHVHMTPADAEALGVKDKDNVFLKIGDRGRETIFSDVVARVSDKYALAVHLDTDEGNACGLTGTTTGEILKAI